MNASIFDAQMWATNYLDYWEESFSEWQKHITKYSEGFTDSYKSFVSKCTEGNFFTAYNDLYGGILGRTFNINDDNPVFTPYNTVINISGLYTKLFKLFTTFSPDGRTDVTEDMKAFLDNWVETQKELFSKMFQVSLPADFPQGDDLAKFTSNIFSIYWNILNDTAKHIPEQAKPFFEDYMNLLEKSGAAIEGITDPAKFTDLYDTWRKVLDKSFEQFPRTFDTVISTQFTDQLKKETDSFFSYITTATEVFVKLYKPGIEAIETTGKKAEELLKDTSPDNIRKFYSFLTENLETNIIGVFKSKQFDEALKTNFNTFMEFRNRHLDMLQSMFENNPLVTQTGTTPTPTPTPTATATKATTTGTPDATKKNTQKAGKVAQTTK